MKRTTLVVVLALVLTFAFATGAFATTGKFFTNSQSYYTWETTTLDNNNVPNGPAVPPVTFGRPTALKGVGANPANPGAHANYLATTAKCGICHSVHRAAGNGTKLLPMADATCAGCHTGSTAVTNKIITVTPINSAWVPSFDASGNVTNGAAAGGAGGPHNDSANDLYADGYMPAGDPNYPPPSYTYGQRYGCFTRRCHATNPHGAGGSEYKIFAAKLLFNDTPAQDAAVYGTPEEENTYGGLDAVYDDLGATDAAVKRFADANPGIITLTGPAGARDIRINGALPDEAETHALVAGLTCGRPSNVGGHDECHAEASYAIVDKDIKENRNHATNFTSPGAYRTDNTMEELPGWGGNDRRDSKTGHVAGTFGVDRSVTAYAPIAGCTSCHDQTDSANTVKGNFTFPHGQTPTGATNLVKEDGVTSATGLRARIWSGYAGKLGDPLVYTAGTPQKAFDGQCLKCHRTFDGQENIGIGLTH